VYRYLALIWNPTDPEKSATARSLIERMSAAPASWQRALDADGVVVFHAGLNEGASETRALDAGAGVVLGRIFPLDMAGSAALSGGSRAFFDLAETTAILATGGKRLFEQYWGRYVAIVRSSRTGEIWVLRDPLGQMPCLLAGFRGVSIVFSDLEDCLKLGCLKLTVNWDYITGLLANSGMMTCATALNEVSDIQLGERVRFHRDTLQRSIEWRPFEIARTDRILDADEAARQLQATTRACIHAWASCYSGLIHNLSGGLDSSIVLACLKDAPTHPAITCLNYYGTGPSEDERQYARLVARHVGAELIESRLDPADVRLERITTLRRSPRPWYYMYELEHGRLETDLASQQGANGLFSGSGGDGIFYQARAELAVADYFFDHGWGAGLLHAAVDAAQVSHKSIWPLLAKAVRARLLPKRFNPIAEGGRPARTLVNADVLRAAARNAEFDHPWFTHQATRGVPPGILWHVSTVAIPPAYYTSFGPETTPERTMPLLSQPLVEVCLRMPSYLLIRSGRDRAIARKAFASDLPATTIKRTAKGRVDQYVRNIVDANLGFLREFLLEGILVRKGLLNRDTLELYLTKERSPADFQYSEILHEHLCVEAWLRRSLESTQAGQPVPPLTSPCESAG
jgi:asparagine synthase (glutamine-hydrolysing)